MRGSRRRSAERQMRNVSFFRRHELQRGFLIAYSADYVTVKSLSKTVINSSHRHAHADQRELMFRTKALQCVLSPRETWGTSWCFQSAIFKVDTYAECTVALMSLNNYIPMISLASSVIVEGLKTDGRTEVQKGLEIPPQLCEMFYSSTAGKTGGSELRLEMKSIN